MAWRRTQTDRADDARSGLAARRYAFGLAYVNLVLAQADTSVSEHVADADWPTDLTIEGDGGGADLVVLAGDSSFGRKRRIRARVPATLGVAWSTAPVPVYLVYVRLRGHDPNSWLVLPPGSTTVRADAYWAPASAVTGSSVEFQRSNRFDASTVRSWLARKPDLPD